jgi:hypothetical protein
MRNDDASRPGVDRPDGRSTTQTVRDGIEALVAARANLDQLTEMLDYFAHLGDSNQLRDYREVRENLLRSRALLSEQPQLKRRLVETVLVLARTFGIEAPTPTIANRKPAVAGPAVAGPAVAGPTERAPGERPPAEPAATMTGPEADPGEPPGEAAPPPAESEREATKDASISSSVFSEIEEILGQPG